MVEPVSKTQAIRVADVFLVGPAMIFGGRKLATKRSSRMLGWSLVIFGVATVLYNGRNYLRQLGKGSE